MEAVRNNAGTGVIMRLKLEVTESPGRRRAVFVEGGQTLKVGRTAQADLAVPEDLMLSRVHFAIEWDGEACRLRDLGSTNGTNLNGRRVETSGPLKNGDEIQAGQTTFRVHFDVPRASAVMPASTSSTAKAIPPPPSVDDRREPELVEPAAPPEGQAVSMSARTEVSRRPLLPIAPTAPEKAVRPERFPGAASRSSKVPAPRVLSADQFVTGTMYWEDLEGTPRMTVILKCTCAMPFDGPAPIADKQLPIFTADVPGGEDPSGSVRFESDMVPFKPKADVVLVGKAHFPRNKPPDTPLDVTLKVGTLEKRIRVFGDRAWWFPTRLALIPEFSTPEPFTTMDLIYERAFGGIDQAAALYCAENLVGRGFIGKRSPDSIDGKPLPNLEDPSDLIRSWDSRPRPVGFGFYGRGWMPRLKLAGTPHHPPDPQERSGDCLRISAMRSSTGPTPTFRWLAT